MLMTNKAGRVRFRSMQSQSHTVAPAEPVTLEWQVTNSLPAQPMKLRSEALMGVSDASTSAVVMLMKKMSKTSSTSIIGATWNSGSPLSVPPTLAMESRVGGYGISDRAVQA